MTDEEGIKAIEDLKLVAEEDSNAKEDAKHVASGTIMQLIVLMNRTAKTQENQRNRETNRITWVIRTKMTRVPNTTYSSSRTEKSAINLSSTQER